VEPGGKDGRGSGKMKHTHYLDQEPERVDADGAKGVVIRHVLTEADGAPHFNLRVLTIESGGRTPDHKHPWEHEFFVLSGKGICITDDGEVEAGKGDAILIPPDVQHCFRAETEMEVI
jgi:quercetin dioxygenase-like cupin family protein